MQHAYIAPKRGSTEAWPPSLTLTASKYVACEQSSGSCMGCKYAGALGRAGAATMGCQQRIAKLAIHQSSVHDLIAYCVTVRAHTLSLMLGQY